MATETIEEKAARYLLDGRLHVEEVIGSGLAIKASCRGDGGLYTVSGWPSGWSCTCPARKSCAHIAALKLVSSLP